MGEKGWSISHSGPVVQPASTDAVGKMLYEQTLQDSEVCDVSLIYAGIEQKVHKCVLMTSHYFHALYESGLLDNDKGKVTINVGSEMAIRSAVKFLYLRTVEVTLNNMSELLEIADYLQISAMKGECCDFLRKLTVGSDNCVTMCILGSQYELEDIYQNGHDYLTAHLPDVLEHSQILSLWFESVLEIILDDTLCYVPPEKLFSFLIRWVEFDLDTRLIHFPDLFCNVNLERFSEEEFNKYVSPHIFINMFPTCREHLAKFTRQLATGVKKLNSAEKQLFLMAGHEAEPLIVLMNNGRSVEPVPTRRLLGYLPIERRWVELPPAPIVSTGHALFTSCDGVLYVTESRAFGRNEHTQQIFKYNFEEKKWSEMKALIPYYDRSKAFRVISLQTCRGRVYALTCTASSAGGKLGDALNIYFLEEGNNPELSWQKELLQHGVDRELTKLQMCVVQDRYICVFLDGSADRTDIKEDDQNSGLIFLYYDLDSGEVIESSKGAMSFKVMFVHNNEVVLAEPGVGYAKVFSFQTQRWRDCRDLSVSDFPVNFDRSDYSFYYDDGKLFVFGGRNEELKKYIKSSLCYDFTERRWENLDSSLCRVVNTSSTPMQIRSAHVQCHLDCPHCKLRGLRRMALYSVLPPVVPVLVQAAVDDWESETEEEEDEHGLDVIRVEVQDVQHDRLT